MPSNTFFSNVVNELNKHPKEVTVAKDVGSNLLFGSLALAMTNEVYRTLYCLMLSNESYCESPSFNNTAYNCGAYSLIAGAVITGGVCATNARAIIALATQKWNEYQQGTANKVNSSSASDAVAVEAENTENKGPRTRSRRGMKTE